MIRWKSTSEVAEQRVRVAAEQRLRKDAERRTREDAARRAREDAVRRVREDAATSVRNTEIRAGAYMSLHEITRDYGRLRV